MIWDRGVYEAEGDAPSRMQPEKGKLKFKLHGKNCAGHLCWSLMGRSADKPHEKSRWLLMKRKDEQADPKMECRRTCNGALSGLRAHLSGDQEWSGAKKRGRVTAAS